MIEPTDEMIADAAREVGIFGHVLSESQQRKVVAAVLAIIERDYERRRCDNPSWTGHRCTKPQGHPDSHYHRFSGTVWP